jgi:hypothetical protein
MKSGEPNSYCKYHFDLPEPVGGKDTPILLDLLHGFVDVHSLLYLILPHILVRTSTRCILSKFTSLGSMSGTP